MLKKTKSIVELNQRKEFVMLNKKYFQRNHFLNKRYNYFRRLETNLNKRGLSLSH